MSKIEIISADELHQALESDPKSHKIKTAGQLLLDAINDWPTLDLTEPSDFLLELIKYIDSPFTYKNVTKYYKSLDTNSQSWEQESLCQTLELFDYNIGDTLESIIDIISKYYKREH